MEQRNYYEAYDERYKTIHDLGLQWFDDAPSDIVVETAIKYGINKESPILELGCGEGRDASLLLSQGYRLLATDISPEAIGYCRRKLPRFAHSFQILDCISGKIGESFDFIYAVAVVHMLVKDLDRQAFYDFIFSHLSENGIALICSMGDGKIECRTDIQSAFEICSRIHEKSGMEVAVANTSCRMVTFDTFRTEIEKASLLIIDQGTTSVLPDFPCMMYAVVKRGK